MFEGHAEALSSRSAAVGNDTVKAVATGPRKTDVMTPNSKLIRINSENVHSEAEKHPIDLDNSRKRI